MVWYDSGRADALKMGRDLNRWQARTPLERRLSARLRHAPRGDCLDFDQLTELARRGRRTPHYYAWMSHIVSCPACRRAYLQTRALIRAQRPRLMRFLSRLTMPKPLVWASATAGAAAVFAFLFWQAREPATDLAAQQLGRPPVTVLQPSNPLAAADARQGEADTPVLADSRLTPRPPATPAGSLPASAQELQAASRFGAFVQEAVELLQQAVAQLGTRAATMPPATSGIRLTQPELESNYSLEPGQLVFRWTPVESAQGYAVRLIHLGDGSDVLNTQLDAAQAEFTLSEPLPPGEYELTITVQEGARQRAYRKRFYVLNAEQLEQLNWARRHASSQPLLSAAVFYKIDRYGEALQAIERALQKFPNDPLVQRWRDVIQRRLSQRQAE